MPVVSWLIVVPTEGTLMDGDLRFAFSLQNNADNVEAAGRRLDARKATNIPARNRYDVPSLASINGRHRWRKPAVGSGFDFNEAKNAVVPSNQINFAPVIRYAKVCGNDPVPQASQVQVRFNFTAFTGQQMFRQAHRQVPAGELQTAHDELGQPHHGASSVR